MSLRLPLSGSPLCNLFSLESLFGWSLLPSLPAASAAAARTLASDDAIVAAHTLCLRADGHVHLLRHDADGFSVLWDFGNPLDEHDAGPEPERV